MDICPSTTTPAGILLFFIFYYKLYYALEGHPSNNSRYNLNQSNNKSGIVIKYLVTNKLTITSNSEKQSSSLIFFCSCYKYAFFVFNSGSDIHERTCCSPDSSSLQLLACSHQLISSQEVGGDGGFCDGDVAEDASQSMCRCLEAHA